MKTGSPFLAASIALLGAPWVVRADGPDFKQAPGVVIAHSPAASKQYIGSPSIAVLPDGGYVASHDFFSTGNTGDRTRVYGSSDRGRSWRLLAEVRPQWWSSLFVHQGKLYLIGTTREYGACVIRRSEDGGATWTEPTDARHGLLLAESGRYHCAPVPTIVHAGRIWRGMEDAQGPGGKWGLFFRAFVMSAPVDADLLDAASWTCSNRIARDPKWLDGGFGGWLEGNAVVTPEGGIVDLLRVDVPIGAPEKAARIAISPDGKRATFDPEHDFLDFPGGAKKFAIRFDPVSKLYWALTNAIPNPVPGRKPSSVRNTLALAASSDLKRWEIVKVLVSHSEVVHHGFQYPDWRIDGADLIAVVRTATDDGLGGAHNNHDANFLTFHRVSNFRSLAPKQP